MRKEIAISAQR